MKKLNEIQEELSSTQKLSTEQTLYIKGGAYVDDKRRQRPGSSSSSIQIVFSKMRFV
jgi:hypothetical protein